MEVSSYGRARLYEKYPLFDTQRKVEDSTQVRNEHTLIKCEITPIIRESASNILKRL